MIMAFSDARKKMKVCMISFGPVESYSNGYFIRCYHIAKSLVELGHEVFIMQFSEEKVSSLMVYVQGIKFINLRGNEGDRNRFSKILKNTFTFDPFHLVKFQAYSLIELIRFREYLKGSEIVFVEGSLIPFGIILPKIFKKKVILDTHCINKLLALNFRDRKFLVYCLRKVLWDILERFATKLSNIVIVVSEKERNFVHREYRIPESNIFVVPNVIEIQRRHSNQELTSLKKKWNLENKIIVTFVGNLESIQNKDAVEYIVNDLAPYFREKRKDVVFLIIGEGKKNFKCDLPNVIFTGFVHDLLLFLEASDICIAPLRVGAGIKTKVLEYLLCGKPIVTTPIGIEGIRISDTNELVVVTKIEEFPEKLSVVVENLTSLKEFISQDLIENNYSEKVMLKNLKFLVTRMNRFS